VSIHSAKAAPSSKIFQTSHAKLFNPMHSALALSIQHLSLSLSLSPHPSASSLT
jgi:hypothetical protein